MDPDGGDDDGSHATDLFQEPKDYFQPAAEPTVATHAMLNGRDLTVRLVGHNPLWGHHLWNAGRTIAHYLEENSKTLVAGRTVLELGAGSGLPSLVCTLSGATKVVVTDYPDVDLIENLLYNIGRLGLTGEKIAAVGYLWGSPVDSLLKLLPQTDAANAGFDLLILADLLFNHSEHEKLIQSVQQTLKREPSASALVFFTPYRPWLLEKDLAFFGLAKQSGFTVEKILERVMDKVMFDNDPGDELLRRTVYGYELKWLNASKS